MTMRPTANPLYLALVLWAVSAMPLLAAPDAAAPAGVTVSDRNSAEANSEPFEIEVAVPEAIPAPEPALEEAPAPVAAPEPVTVPTEKTNSGTFEGSDEILAKINAELDAASPAPSDDDASNETSAPLSASLSTNALRVFVVLCFVVMLIIASRLLVRRFGASTPLLAGSKYARILGRVYLDPRTALHFVAIRDKVLVLGVTQTSVSLVSSFNAGAFPESAPGDEVSGERDSGGSTDFLSTLRMTSQSMPVSGEVEDTEIVSLRGDIERLQRYLKEGSREPNE